MDNYCNSKGPSKYTCFKISKAMRKIQRYYETALAPFEITAVQFFILSILREHNGLKFKELAEQANMDGSTLTGILDRLEKNQFIERRKDPEDRRSLLIFLTEKAINFGPQMMETADCLEEKLKSQFSPEEFAVFSQVLETLLQAEI